MRFCLILLIGIFFGCSSNLETVETKNEFGYIIKYTRSKTDYAKQGKYVSLYPNGKPYEEANYVNDVLHGERKLYFENGNVEVLETYDMGDFISPYKTFYEDGTLKQEGAYEKNVAIGQWKKYYTNGQLMENVTLVDNEENGPFLEFYENGNKKTEGTYKGFDTEMNRPREHGELLLYDESGTLVKKMNCDMGVCRTTWTLENEDVKKE